MDITQIKNALKNKKWTYEDLARESGVALITIKKILSGSARYPRVDTVQAIEKALGIYNSPELSEDAQEVLRLFRELTPEELAELEQFIDFIISKRRK